MSQLDLTRPMPPETAEKKSFAELVRAKVSTVLTGRKADEFVTSVISLMSQDQSLAQCEPISIVASALQAQSLQLSLNRALGQAWIVAYNDNKNRRVMATFQLGYKGYIQLAIRSGQYRKLNVLPIKEGELKFFDPLNEELEVALIQDDAERDAAPTIGYYAMFEYLNGFRKALFWTKAKMEAHARRYSKAYATDLKKGWTSSFWSKDFDAMACKTMLRQIISKWGIMSVDLQKAFEADMREVNDVNAFGDVVDAEAAPTEATGAPLVPEPLTYPCPRKDNAPVDADDCLDCPERNGCPARA